MISALNPLETIYQVKKPDDKNVLYMSIKGFEDLNEYQIYVYNRTIAVIISGQESLHQVTRLLVILPLLVIIISTLII